MELKTQPNEKRCRTMNQTHRLELKPCCPISGNPLAGSFIEIKYDVADLILEVEALRAYVDSFAGGRGDVRSMEGMCQQITQDCANAVQTMVHTKAILNIAPEQEMVVECAALVTHPLDSCQASEVCPHVAALNAPTTTRKKLDAPQ